MPGRFWRDGGVATASGVSRSVYAAIVASPDNEAQAIEEDAQCLGALRPMPLVELFHGVPFAAPFLGWPAEATEAIMAELQEDLTRLISPMPAT